MTSPTRASVRTGRSIRDHATDARSLGASMDVRVKRVYEPAERSDGYRILIDRLWPRGVSHDRAKLDAWEKDLAPSAALRTWFGHQPDLFDEFRRRYVAELRGHRSLLSELRQRARRGTLTLLYA